MDINEIQALIKFVAKSGVSEVEIESKGFKIVIKTPSKNEPSIPAPVQVVHATAAPTPPPSQVQAEQTSQAAEPVKEDNKYITIKSPMIGTFYRSAGPGKPPFVNVGDEIELGKVICIIEAMKLFNEIESEFSGKIIKVLIEDGKPVEYDQALFLVEPA